MKRVSLFNKNVSVRIFSIIVSTKKGLLVGVLLQVLLPSRITLLPAAACFAMTEAIPKVVFVNLLVIYTAKVSKYQNNLFFFFFYIVSVVPPLKIAEWIKIKRCILLLCELSCFPSPLCYLRTREIVFVRQTLWVGSRTLCNGVIQWLVSRVRGIIQKSYFQPHFLSPVQWALWNYDSSKYSSLTLLHSYLRSIKLWKTEWESELLV